MRPALAVLLLALPAALSAQALAPRPVQAVRTGAFQDPRLSESSGVAASARFPRVLYTVNDSGNDPVLFATDSSGRPLGAWRVPGAANRDWEALTLGPCPAGRCLVIGDTGDNAERRPRVVLYRFPEPVSFMRFRGAADPAPLGLDSAVVRYPDRPHDVEAMWLDDDGNVLLVTKGRRDGIRLFRVPASAFGDPAGVTATLLQVLPISPEQSLGRWVTDAARAPDGRRVAIRTYTEVYLFPQLPAGRLGSPVVCNVAGLETQGEGITWLDDRRMLLTSERSGHGPGSGAIHVVTCDG